MCFSATASFTAAGVLAPLGAVSLMRAWRGERRYLALATLPVRVWGVAKATVGTIQAASPDTSKPTARSRPAAGERRKAYRASGAVNSIAVTLRAPQPATAKARISSE